MSKKKQSGRVPLSQAEILHQAKRRATHATAAIFLSALHDEEGFGKTRLLRIWEKVEKLSEEISDGRITVQDLIRTLEEECGIRLG